MNYNITMLLVLMLAGCAKCGRLQELPGRNSPYVLEEHDADLLDGPYEAKKLLSSIGCITMIHDRAWDCKS